MQASAALRSLTQGSLEAAAAVLRAAPFINHLGVRLRSVEKGSVVTELEVQPWQKQVSNGRLSYNMAKSAYSSVEHYC